MEASSSSPVGTIPTVRPASRRRPRPDEARPGRARGILALLVMALVLVACFVCSLCVGRYSITPAQVVQAIAARVCGQAPPDQMVDNIVFSVRMPRVVLAVVVGAGLSAAGAAYQAVFSNPLVSSDILGVSSGASFGAALGILISGEALLVEGLALGMGLVAVGAVILLGRVQRRTQLYMLVLAGVIVSALFEALVSLIKYVSDPYDKLPAITTWLMGSMASASYSDVAVCSAVILPCCVLLLGLRWKLNLLSLDEEEARSLGINVVRLRLAVILIATFMTAVTVSMCGVIGWIGLVIPHVGRMLLGNDHRTLVPASMLLGGSYLLLIDDVARAATGAEIPLSILTAIVGAPFFAWILRRTGGERK